MPNSNKIYSYISKMYRLGLHKLKKKHRNTSDSARPIRSYSTVSVNLKHPSKIQKQKARIFSNRNLNNLKSLLKQNWKLVLIHKIFQTSLSSSCLYSLKRQWKNNKLISDEQTENLKKEILGPLRKEPCSGPKCNRDTVLRKKEYDLSWESRNKK